MNERIASGVGPSRIDIAYEEHGDRAHPTVLLVMGLGAQLVRWPLGFVEAIVARGFHVVRFDNRDSGRSTHMHDAPMPNLPAVLAGDRSSVSYTLADMAADAVGLLDALHIEAAHVVGASMGAGIAQLMAIEHPKRVLSLTSIMFSTGDPTVGRPHPETVAALFGGPPAKTRDEAIARALRAAPLLAAPGFPPDPAEVERIAGISFDRDSDELGMARQGVATVAAGDRTAKLRALRVPTLVVHGVADTLVDPSGGRATAEAIPGAELMLVEGMGHNLPPAVWNPLADAIFSLSRRRV